MLPLLHAIIDNPADRYRWLILADWFADEGDTLGEEWCRWVHWEGIWAKKSNSCWYLKNPSGHDVFKMDSQLGLLYGEKFHSYLQVKLYGRDSALTCYLDLLAAYRQWKGENVTV